LHKCNVKLNFVRWGVIVIWKQKQEYWNMKVNSINAYMKSRSSSCRNLKNYYMNKGKDLKVCSSKIEIWNFALLFFPGIWKSLKARQSINDLPSFFEKKKKIEIIIFLHRGQCTNHFTFVMSKLSHVIWALDSKG
jgi:hypothetical protein